VRLAKASSALVLEHFQRLVVQSELLGVTRAHQALSVSSLPADIDTISTCQLSQQLLLLLLLVVGGSIKEVALS